MKTNQPVCVTGASGFIASQIVVELLKAGYSVRGTVRDPVKSAGYFAALPVASERLHLMKADLLEDGSFHGAVDGCEFVIHTASPYFLDTGDPRKDLLDPAVQGTQNVLNSCMKAASVKKIILTSSVAAIFDEPVSDHIYTEEDWNEKSSLKRNPYYYSKTLAERSAWNFIRQQETPFNLVTINPSVVIGPSLVPSLNTSNKIFSDLFNGQYPVIMNLSWGFVDVRDVAQAHLLAMENETSNGRYLCSAETLTMAQIVGFLRESGFHPHGLPRWNLTGHSGSFLVGLMAFTQPRGVRTFIRTHLGRKVNYDNSKIKRELGLTFRPVRDSILETIKDLLSKGHIRIIDLPPAS